MRLTETLSFHLAPASYDPSGRHGFDASDAFSQEFIRSVGLKVNSGCWSTVLLDDPRFQDFLAAADALIERGEAEFYGYCTLTQQSIAETAQDYEWYEVRPREEFPGDERRVSAYRVSPLARVAKGIHATFVSERFVNAVTAAGLKGLDFHWVPDTGKYRASQWFLPVPGEAIGHGVDHPWFDPSLREAVYAQEGIESSGLLRTGVSRFERSEMKSDLLLSSPAHTALLSLFRGAELTILAPRTYLRAALPADVDFAYGFTDEVPEDRPLFASARAAEILLSQKLVSMSELEPILVVDELPLGVEPLDGKAETPGPYLGTLATEVARATREAAWQKSQKVERPARPTPKLPQTLRYLKQEKKDRPQDFCNGITKKAIAKLEYTLPESWQKVLAVSNGGTLHDECELIPTDRVAAVGLELQDLDESLYRPGESPLSGRQRPIATAPDGDWFCLDATDADPQDPRVLRVSHEGCTISHEWSNIPAFLYDLLSGEYRSES